MGKQNFEKSLIRMANSIPSQLQEGELYRLFRVYHPVYEISVNIESLLVEENYHIIEQYMDKLVCGYKGKGDTAVQVSKNGYVRNKNELFELLGLEKQAYEIAEMFFEDLVRDGHFEVREKENRIIGKKTAVDSLKLQKRVTSKTDKIRKLFDHYSKQLMPKEFYDFRKYVRSRDNIDEDSKMVKYSVWLNPDIAVDPVDVERAIRGTAADYSGTTAIDRGLPQGYKGLTIAEGEEISCVYYPYYLAIIKVKDEFIFKGYRIDNGKEIEWIGEQYQTAEYSDAKSRIMVLAEYRERVDVRNPLNDKNFLLTQGGEPSKENGVESDKDTGNYVWTLQDWQLQDLLGLGKDKLFKRDSCSMVANNEVACLAHFEAGKIVKIVKTVEQAELLKDAIEAKNQAERNALFQEYAGHKEVQAPGNKSGKEAEEEAFASDPADLSEAEKEYRYAVFLEGIDEDQAIEHFKKAMELGHEKAKQKIIEMLNL